MIKRTGEQKRHTRETRIHVKLTLDGRGKHDISSGIPFFDHMLTLFTVHGFFDLTLRAEGDLEVDFHHTVEDVGLILGDVLNTCLGDRKGIQRFGHAAVPMDDALSTVTVDLSNRPFLVYNVPDTGRAGDGFNTALAKEFFRSFAVRSGMNLHVNVFYGENDHHIIESIYKATGRALAQAVSIDKRIVGVHSSKGKL